jgi:hypothetical protein
MRRVLWPSLALLLVSMIAGAALASQIVTNPQEPPEYADGVYCTPAGTMAYGIQMGDHPCACKNMLRDDKDGCCDVPVTNDPVCQQWCHEKHCACPKACVPGSADETEAPR